MMNVRNIAGWISLIILLIGGYFIVTNMQQIQDWWVLRSYTPTQEIAELSELAGFNDNGQSIFYVTDPQINDKESFNINCPFEEHTIVLGCYNGSQIFILGVDDPQLEGVETVTSAHEMLHAAYDRLDPAEKEEIVALLNEEFANTDNQRIIDLVNEYDTSDQELINNELHSILPTELETLSPELEEYYSRYFDDRQKTVAAAKSYEAVFVNINAEIDALRANIDSYKQQIDALEAELALLTGEITSQRQELNRLRNTNNVEEYNSLVPGFNSLVNRHNTLVGELSSTISLHNSLVAEVNSKAVQHNALIQTIDSNYQPIEN